jgi:hypothetical protein
MVRRHALRRHHCRCLPLVRICGEPLAKTETCATATIQKRQRGLVVGGRSTISDSDVAAIRDGGFQKYQPRPVVKPEKVIVSLMSWN